MKTNQSAQQPAQQPQMNPMAGGMGAFNTMQMGGGGMNPFAAAGGGMGYQNPNHNKPLYNTSANPNAFAPGGGPSAESWMRDVNELGMNVKLDVKPVRDTDNIKEFQDLFSTAKDKSWSSSAPKRTVDLSYNPGVVPAQPAAHSQPQPQPAPVQDAFVMPPAQPAPVAAASNPFEA